jgi:YtcA family
MKAPLRAPARLGLLASVVLAGCDPTLNLWGSLLPAWVLCLVLAVCLSVLVRWVFSLTHLERHLGPLWLVYPCLVVFWACFLWLVLFRG